MKGGVTLFRGTGAAACRYLESDRSTADEYYLESGIALAELTVTDAAGEVVAERSLGPEEYAAWVDWTNPLTGTSMGTPRLPGDGRRGSPRFAEMVVNTPKSLSIAAALQPEVADALDVAQRDAAHEIRRWLAQHSVTRVGPRGAQEVVPVERLQSVAVLHRTSRAGDPHRHIHIQIGTRVHAVGRWRALDTAALFKQQGAIRALGTAVVAAHPHLAAVLHQHGLTLDPVTGEVVELEPFNAVLSKRAAQVERNLAVFMAEWDAAHPGQVAGPLVRARLHAKAWDYHRPNKKPTTLGGLGSEEGWRRELTKAGYTPDARQASPRHPVELDQLRVQQLAARALDRCAAGASAWTVHTITEHVTRIITEHGVRATGGGLRDLIAVTTRLAVEDCLSVLPPGTAQPEHVAHLTSLRVVAADTELRNLLTARAETPVTGAPDVSGLAHQRGLDADQERAAAAVASAAPLVVVEGAAGAGKTTMLGVAITAAAEQGTRMRVVTPTKKAADVAVQELGVPADSVAALVYAHGWRWNADGVWTRLHIGDTDPDTGRTYVGPPQDAVLVRGERIVVDEAGMLDQDTALALLHVADEAGASLALVGDRAQLAAVGRGGVLDVAASLVSQVYDMATVHRFPDPDYASLTVRLRQGENPAGLFDQLQALGRIQLHRSGEDVHDVIAATAQVGDAVTTATNDDARALNERIHQTRVQLGEVDDTCTTFGSDGLHHRCG
ncbi:MobF family relaxase [Georgenia sp.]